MACLLQKQTAQDTYEHAPVLKWDSAMCPSEACIRGILIPVAWHRDGNVKTLAVATYDESEIILAANRLERELRAFLRHRLEAWGRLEQKSGKTRFTVTRYRLDAAPPDTTIASV
jgi:hypothetical protein